jgi:hypothetical protein
MPPGTGEPGDRCQQVQKKNGKSRTPRSYQHRGTEKLLANLGIRHAHARANDGTGAAKTGIISFRDGSTTRCVSDQGYVTGHVTNRPSAVEGTQISEGNWLTVLDNFRNWLSCAA